MERTTPSARFVRMTDQRFPPNSSPAAAELFGGGAVILNDVHSRLNPTRPAALLPVSSLHALRAAVSGAHGGRISVAGGRHAMGGQQFATGGTVLDTRGMSRVLHLDRQRGLV